MEFGWQINDYEHEVKALKVNGSGKTLVQKVLLDQARIHLAEASSPTILGSLGCCGVDGEGSIWLHISDKLNEHH